MEWSPIATVAVVTPMAFAVFHDRLSLGQRAHR
jgi:hypothetical protein